MLGFTAPPRSMATDTVDAETPPDNVVPPVLSGSFFAGQTLMCSTGTWAGSPAAFEYRWKKNGATNGDTDNQYTGVSGDDGDDLLCEVRAGNTAGWSDWVPSNSVTIFAAAQWLKNSISHTGNSISVWSDDSGHGRDVSQGTPGNQPTLTANFIGTKSAVVFDGTNDRLTRAAFLYDLGAVTVFIVQKTNAEVADRAVISERNSASSNAAYNIATNNGSPPISRASLCGTIPTGIFFARPAPSRHITTWRTSWSIPIRQVCSICGWTA